MKAILIDVTARDIREVEYQGLPDLQALVGGYIETAWSWDNGEVLFVDEEGLFKPQTAFFRLPRLRPDGAPFAGSGVVVGRERHDREGEYLGTDDPRITVAELREEVQFLTRAQADAWAKGNASEPASSITFIDPRTGQPVTEVLGRYGSLYAEMPKPEPEDEP